MDKQYGMLNHPGVKKKILVGGAGPLPHFPPGTKLVFHFQTLKDNFERTVIDDSRLAKRPAEIFVGKMFKMEVWETLLTSMRVGEVAEFWCGAIHTGLYAIVSKGMRLIAQGKDPLEGQKHMCGMGNLFNYHSTGYPELDELMKDPQPLIFIMELLQVGDPFSYKRESWMMEKDEKLEAVPSLHMQGNALVKQMRYKEAAAMYQEAVVLLRTVQSREMPGHEDYINLARLIIPLVLNYCQCMFEMEEYYEVIEHTTELLDKHPDCVKGYYKRAKAHMAVWNEKEARRDFNRVASLDVTLAPLIHRELKSLSECMKEKYWEEKEKYWNILEEKERKRKEEEEEEEEEEKVTEEKDEDQRDKEENDEGEKDEGASTVGDEEPKTEHLYVTKEEVRGDGKEERAPVRLEQTPSEEVAVRPVSQLQSAPRAATEGKDWQQMLRLVMFLQEEGNFYMKEQRHDQGARKFQEALEYVDHLQSKETAYKGEDWESLEKVRLPLTLNLSQCMLEMQDYQQVVELTNKLLKTHKGNLKALYQRARAHSALCHEEQARRDFTKLQSLDASFKPAVRLELKKMGENIRLRHIHQRKTYRDTTQEKWGPGGAKGPATAAGKKPEKTVTFTDVQGSAGKEAADGKAGGRIEEEERRPEERRPEELASADARVDRGARELEEADGRGDEESGNERRGDAGATGGGERGAKSGAVPGDGQAQPDKPAGDRDTDPAQSTGATDNVASKRSGPDKGRRKVKRPSGAGKGPAKAGQGNKGTEDDTASGHTQSTPTSINQLPAFSAGTTGEAGGRGSAEAKVGDRQAAGGRETDRKSCEAKVEDRQAAGGRETDRKSCEAKVGDRQAAGGRETDRKGCEVKVGDRQAAGGRETDRKSCEAKVEDRQAAGGRETDRKSCEAKVEDRQAAGGRETDRKGCEAKVGDRQAAGGRETDRKSCEAKVEDRQAAGGRETDKKGCEAKVEDRQAAGGSETDRKGCDGQQAEPLRGGRLEALTGSIDSPAKKSKRKPKKKK